MANQRNPIRSPRRSRDKFTAGSDAFVGALGAPEDAQAGDGLLLVVYGVKYPPITDADPMDCGLELQGTMWARIVLKRKDVRLKTG